MNKSLLIVICDFLLLSLLSIANFDKPQQNKAQKKRAETAAQSESFVQTQMLETLKIALDAEQQRHRSLSQDVEKLSRLAESNKQRAQSNEKIIRERERQIAQMQSAKTELEREREKILQRSAELEQKVASANTRNNALQGEIIKAAENLERSARERIELERSLGQMREVDAATKTQLKNVQEQLRQNKSNLSRLQKESEQLKLENRAIQAEKTALAAKLEVASTKTLIYEQNLQKAEALVKTERAEKNMILEHAQSLSGNVSELASTQKKLTQDIGEMRPKTASEIFGIIAKKFVSVSFKYSESGMLGRENAVQKIDAVPVSFGGRDFLFFDISATPFFVSKPNMLPEKMEVSVSANGKIWYADKFATFGRANAVLALELPAGFLDKDGAIKAAQKQNLYKFAECVVVDVRTKYYGQVPFMANFTNREFAKLDVGLVDSIFKKFSPSAADIAFTRGAEAVGVLTSSNDVLIFSESAPAGQFFLGKNYNKNAAALLLMKK